MKPIASARWVEQVERQLFAHGIDLPRVCDQLAMPVLCEQIRTDFQGEPFEGSKQQLAWADNLIELKTNCRSGKQATMNAGLDEHRNRVTEGAQIDIGHHSEVMIRLCTVRRFRDPRAARAQRRGSRGRRRAERWPRRWAATRGREARHAESRSRRHSRRGARQS